jgi:hypothetical protein
LRSRRQQQDCRCSAPISVNADHGQSPRPMTEDRRSGLVARHLSGRLA